MPFVKSDKKVEEKQLSKLVKTSEKARKAREDFLNDYNFRMMLVEARKQQNISQKELSNITGLSQQMISRVETGSTDTTIRTLIKYLNGIGFGIKLIKNH